MTGKAALIQQNPADHCCIFLKTLKGGTSQKPNLYLLPCQYAIKEVLMRSFPEIIGQTARRYSCSMQQKES